MGKQNALWEAVQIELLDYVTVLLLASFMSIVQSIFSEVGKDIKKALEKKLKKDVDDQHNSSKPQ